ncbi:unnamed protein product [Heterobilharzia americana]|nr:unnamed protein product [Heterobilharzia americana]
MHLSGWIDFCQHIYTSSVLAVLLTVHVDKSIHIDAQPSRVIRIKENIPAGTVIIPDVINFLGGRSYSSVDNYDLQKDRKVDHLLAIGNSVMQGANWFAIDDVKKSLYIKTPPDRDILCPSEQKLPETAVSIAHGGIEFPEYNLNPGSKYNLQIASNNVDNNDCIIKLSIIHGSSANPSFDMLTVILEDINDHAPSFKEIQNNMDSKTNEFIISVPETPRLIDKKDDGSIKHRIEQRPVRILLPTAIDPDEGVNGVKGYRLEGEDAFLFRLEIGPAIDTDISHRVHKEFHQVGLFQDHKTNRLWLVPTGNSIGGGGGTDALNIGELDKEQRSEYHFVLIAYDGGSPSRMGKLPIGLIVEDVNDHAPEFNREFYTGRMSETDPGGHVIFEFSARDKDNTKENGIVKFRLPGKATIAKRERISLSESQLAAAELFSIEYSFDKPGDLINLQDNLQNSTTYGRLIVRRQSKEKIQIAASKAIAIARQNQILGGSKSISNFPVQQTHTNEISLNSDQLHFVIEAYDNAPTPLVTRVPVIVLITDVNDHAPQIFISYLRPTRPLTQVKLYNNERRQMWGKVTENLDRAMIAQVTVTDKDATFSNSDVVCRTNDSRFSLEEIVNGIDRPEDLSSYWSRNNFYGSSNLDSKSHQLDWQATSKPLTKMYKLMLVSSLDRESNDIKTSLLKFSIICVDNQHNELPGGSLTSQTDVFLEIEDANDNPPVFDHTEYTFHLPENYPKVKSEHNLNHLENDRYTIGMVHASDKDEGVHGNVEYKLVSNPTGSIQIDQFSGVLYATQPFDREIMNEIVFQVIAIDCILQNGTKERQCDPTMRLTGSANIRVIIDDLNDCPPIFQETNYHFEVEEGLDLVKVGQVFAVDADQDEAARIVYRLAVGINNRFKEPIVDGNIAEQVAKTSANQNLYDEALEITTHFQIDPRSGLIHLKGRLDRERRAHYEFIVLALDNPRAIPTKIAGYHRQTGSEVIQFTATATVLITVLDHNDNPPRILSPLNHVEFMLSPDQLIAGNTIFTIRATDPDLGENGTIEFRLLQVEDDLGSWISSDSAQRSVQTNHENTTDPDVQFDQGHKALDTKDLNDVYPFANDNKRISTNRKIRSSSEFIIPSEHESGPDAKAGTWTTSGQARISDRTMVVILSSVFVLLLLTTIVLLLLVRYRRLLIRNIPLEQSFTCDGPDSKANEGFAAGKPLSQSQNNLNGYNGFFGEVVTAPWVRGSTSPMACATPYNYPTIYNTGVSRSRGCIVNPNACWSPTTTLCKSPISNHESQRRLMQTPTSMCHTSPTHTFRLLPTFTGGCGGESGRLFDSPALGVNSAFPGFHGGFVLQNYTMRDDNNEDEDHRSFPDTAPNNQVSNKTHLQSSDEKQQNHQIPMSDQIFSKSVANNLHCQSKLPETEITQSFSSLKRTAISLEELNDYKDEINSRNYSRLVRFQLAQDELLPNNPVNCVPVPSRSEYQTLTSFHRDEEKCSQRNIPLFPNWIKHNQEEPNESFANPYDQLNCKLQFKPVKSNNTFKINHTTHNSSILQDFFQLQPLTQSQHSEGSKTALPHDDNVCKLDDLYLSTVKTNVTNHNDIDFMPMNKMVNKLNKTNTLKVGGTTNYPTSECGNNLSNFNQVNNEITSNSNNNHSSSNDKSPVKLIDDKKTKSTRQNKVVTLISPKKESSVIMNETNCFFTDKGTGVVNKSLNTEGSFV